MMDESILQEYGAIKANYRKGEMVFVSGVIPRYYFQIISGEVKMSNDVEYGREFIQKIFANDESFGEPPLIGNFPYPSQAECITDVELWQLGKEGFIRILRENFDIHFRLSQILSKRLAYKSMLLTELTCHDAEHRIRRIIDQYKRPSDTISGYFEFPYTRQQLADRAGLRVETAIRIVRKLSQRMDSITLKDNKILLTG